MRWQRYLQIQREAKFVEDKAAFLRQKEARGKSISQWSRQHKKK